jgi:hypothetical protein
VKTRIEIVFGLIIYLHLTSVFAGEKGTLTVIGDMTYPRQEHTSTLLNNGKVLIVGWDSKTSEVYDPGSGIFSVTGSTNVNHRQGFTATLLNDGKVLVAGGVNALTKAELYDPLTGVFTLTDSLKNVHSYHTATLLPNGTVLMAGGQDHAGPQTHAVAEIYDPVSGTFSLTGSLKEHRSTHTATLLPDGKVLIAGGIQTTTPGSGKYLDACEIYDPVSGSFTLIRSMTHPRISHTATLLTNQKVLVSGGAYYSNTGELYDHVAQTWTLTGPMTVIRRSSHTATRLLDGRVLLAGGHVESATSKAELFDPATNAFNPADSLTAVRTQHRASLLTNGIVLITGGYNGTTVLKSAELVSVPGATAVEEGESPDDRRGLPRAFFLAQNYPNPFNPSTTIRYGLPDRAHVTLTVFNTLGQEVGLLLDGEQEGGYHDVQFDGSGLSSGVYFYRIQTVRFVETRILLLVR